LRDLDGWAPPSAAGNDNERAPRFGIYVHWPFCLAKCPYCDFNSHVRHGPLDEPRFVRAFATEIAYLAAHLPGRSVSSVFFGGGTPSLMAPPTVAAVLEAISGHWSIAPDVEVTLEANPTSVEAGRFRGYRTAGVNRVSLGVQALEDSALKTLGRRHTVAEALEAIAIARAVFTRFSFDLIYARPGQTPAAWRAELERAIAEGSEHLSLYQLTIEAQTPFAALRAAGKLTLPQGEEARGLYELTQERCEAHGLPAYEVANHARPRGECRHNLIYWRCGEYAGVGPGAHGRLGVGKVRRATATEPHPERWLKQVETTGHGLVTDDVLTLQEQADELLLMGLRLHEGVDPRDYAQLARRSLDTDRVAALRAHGLVEITSSGRLRVTAEGFPVLDAVVADLAA
jgi:putative oxygen-independent coproporphyrinogen III oxidase